LVFTRKAKVVTEAGIETIHFEEMKGQKAKNCRWPVEADKGKIINSVFGATRINLCQAHVINPVTLILNF
jgi:hypothetical protein